MAAVAQERLYVYGTLAPGRPNAHLLSGVVGTWEKGTVYGHLLAEGWGADQGYPGIMLDPSAQPVAGFVFTSEQLSQEWERLDLFEGTAYRRVVAPVHLESGLVVEAFVYQLNR
jgi:gamma-glutamylcyclotransferase (GGCT)/AIG2-like uncharacterized protein YtfP